MSGLRVASRLLGDSLAITAARKINESARAQSPRHEPLRLEPVQGGADRGARCAEGRGEPALGRKFLAVHVATVEDRLAQLRGDRQGAGNGIPDDGFAAAGGGQPNFSHCNRLGMIGISLV